MASTISKLLTQKMMVGSDARWRASPSRPHHFLVDSLLPPLRPRISGSQGSGVYGHVLIRAFCDSPPREYRHTNSERSAKLSAPEDWLAGLVGGESGGLWRPIFAIATAAIEARLGGSTKTDRLSTTLLLPEEYQGCHRRQQNTKQPHTAMKPTEKTLGSKSSFSGTGTDRGTIGGMRKTLPPLVIFAMLVALWPGQTSRPPRPDRRWLDYESSIRRPDPKFIKRADPARLRAIAGRANAKSYKSSINRRAFEALKPEANDDPRPGPSPGPTINAPGSCLT